MQNNLLLLDLFEIQPLGKFTTTLQLNLDKWATTFSVFLQQHFISHCSYSVCWPPFKNSAYWIPTYISIYGACQNIWSIVMKILLKIPFWTISNKHVLLSYFVSTIFRPVLQILLHSQQYSDCTEIIRSQQNAITKWLKYVFDRTVIKFRTITLRKNRGKVCFPKNEF